MMLMLLIWSGGMRPSIRRASTAGSWFSLPDAPGTVLNVGAGSGRDAAWFSGQGYDVIAVEPSSGMRSEGQRLHPEPRIRWINDQLPDLSVVSPLAISFDVVMLKLQLSRRDRWHPR